MVARQLQVKRRTGKVRRSKTNVLPLYHAANVVIRHKRHSVHVLIRPEGVSCDAERDVLAILFRVRVIYGFLDEQRA